MAGVPNATCSRCGWRPGLRDRPCLGGSVREEADRLVAARVDRGTLARCNDLDARCREIPAPPGHGMGTTEQHRALHRPYERGLGTDPATVRLHLRYACKARRLEMTVGEIFSHHRLRISFGNQNQTRFRFPHVSFGCEVRCFSLNRLMRKK